MKSREDEKKRYEVCYEAPRYKMGNRRKVATEMLIRSLGRPKGKSFLDVGCGRGEMVSYAERLGYSARGVEQVEALIDDERIIRGDACAVPLPDKSVDVACSFDVLEHLIPGDDEIACRELARLARKHVLITVSNNPSPCPITREELHINKRPYAEWYALFCTWFEGEVVWAPIELPNRPRRKPEKIKGEMFWRINLA